MKRYYIYNLLSILLIFILAELACIHYDCRIFRKEKNSNDYICSVYSKKLLDFPTRQPCITNSEQPAVLVIGCSFGYGLNLEDKDCFHYILSQITGRSVFNISLPSGSPREMLYMLENRIKIPSPPVDYVIYVFIPDHIRRLYYDLNINAPKYKYNNKTKKLVFEKDKLYQHSFLYLDFGLVKHNLATKKEKTKLFYTYIKQINEKIKQLYPNSKFVILMYSESYEINWKDIENAGIKLIHINRNGKYDKSEYILSNEDCHPNAKAWHEITPKIVKELNL